jgi:hypothetical protein
MTDMKVRRTKALQLLKPYWNACEGIGFTNKASELMVNRGGFSNIAGRSGSSSIRCVFGRFYNDSKAVGSIEEISNKLKYNSEMYANTHLRTKCGIEILGAKPNATGNTYSSKCYITVNDLKQACKDNGIKITKLDKKGLLAALMKV